MQASRFWETCSDKLERHWEDSPAKPCNWDDTGVMAVVRALKNPTLPIDLMCDRIAVNRRWILLRSGGEDYYLLLELGAQTVCTDAKSLAALPTETLGTP